MSFIIIQELYFICKSK